MALKNNWNDLVDGESFVEVEPINRMAHAIIANEENILSVQKLSESIQSENKSQEAEINELSKDLTRFEGDAVRLDSKINENKKRITNLERGIPSDLFLTDSSIAYSKDVPQNALPYAEVRKIGGKTRKCMNLLDLDSATLESCVRDGDTVRSNIHDFYYSSIRFYTKSDWLLSMRGKPITFSVKENKGKLMGIVIYGARANGSTYQEEGVQNRSVTMVVADDFLTVDAFELRINRSNTPYTDTTSVFEELMLNEGAEPLPYEPYFEGLRSAPVSEVESVGADETVIGTLPIPEAVQALDGYGDGVNESVYNYIDLDKKQFVKRVGKVDMGTLDWLYADYYGSGVLCFYSNSISDAKFVGAFTAPNALSAPYEAINPTYMSQGGVGFTLFDAANQIALHDPAYTDAATFKAAMSGVMLYYELATPVVTDISDLVFEDNFIGVGGNGTITMANQYKYNVPSEIVFMLDEV